jgi:hypothetical protein
MRGVSYDYTFMLPDKTYLSFTDQSMPELLANVKKLTKTHYDLDFKISRDTVYNIIHRPDVAHKFYASKISIKNIIRPVKKEPVAQQHATVSTEATLATNTLPTPTNTTQSSQNTEPTTQITTTAQDVN